MNRLATIRLACGVALSLAAIALGSALRLPALAEQGYQTYIVPMTSCASSTPCASWSNSKSGAGVQGISTGGNGTNGQTKFKSTSATNAKAGVLGQDNSTSGSFDSGVLGTSTNGIGVQGTSVNGNGVIALSKNQSALFAENSGFSDGIQSIALNNDGTNSSTQNDSSVRQGRSGIWGHDDSTDGGKLNVGVAGSSTNGTGVSGNSALWVGVDAVGGYEGTAGVPALSVTGGQFSLELITACGDINDNPCSNHSGSLDMEMDHNGDLRVAGRLFSSGGCSSGCAVGPNGIGHRVLSYAPTQTVPSLDDFGEAQLVNGAAHVRLSPDFANAIDQHASYLVFITPEGNSHGVYVTDKSATAFTVRENDGGHATIAFSYRIVARPYGINKSRLPMEWFTARSGARHVK